MNVVVRIAQRSAAVAANGRRVGFQPRGARVNAGLTLTKLIHNLAAIGRPGAQKKTPDEGV